MGDLETLQKIGRSLSEHFAHLITDAFFKNGAGMDGEELIKLIINILVGFTKIELHRLSQILQVEEHKLLEVFLHVLNIANEHEQKEIVA